MSDERRAGGPPGRATGARGPRASGPARPARPARPPRDGSPVAISQEEFGHVAHLGGGRSGPRGGRRYPPASVPDDHPASKLPRRRLAVLRPGEVVPGVITRLVRGGALVDILLESGEPAFVPLSEIPAKYMQKVRDLIDQGTLQEVRIVQLDRASGTATASLRGLIDPPPPDAEQEPERIPVRAPVPAPAPPPTPKPLKPVSAGPPKISASERARKQQEEILRRLRTGDA